MLLSEQDQLLRQSVHEFAERELKPAASQWDEREGFALDSFRRLSKLGLMGLTIPSVYGGSDGGYQQLAIVMEEVAWGCGSTSLIYTATLSLAVQSFLNFGNEKQKQSYLPRFAKGELLGAFAYTEPDAGSDAGGIRTSARRDGDEFILDGQKVFITNGDVADVLVVFATMDRSLQHRGITVFIVEKGTPGLSTRHMDGKLGMRGSPTAEVFFEHCRVPATAQLGEEGQGFKYLMKIIDSGRIIIGAQAIGLAQAALDDSVGHLKQRQQFGRSLAEFQGLQWMVADMATQIEAARLLVHQAAQRKDQGLSYTKESAMAKVFATEMAMAVTTQAVQLHGGYGYFRDTAVQRYFRDAKVTEIYEGTSQIQRLVIARKVLGDH